MLTRYLFYHLDKEKEQKNKKQVIPTMNKHINDLKRQKDLEDQASMTLSIIKKVEMI